MDEFAHHAGCERLSDVSSDGRCHEVANLCKNEADFCET